MISAITLYSLAQIRIEEIERQARRYHYCDGISRRSIPVRPHSIGSLGSTLWALVRSLIDRVPASPPPDASSALISARYGHH